MTPKQFWRECRQHDWYYAQSDDRRYWIAGAQHEKLLRETLADQPELQPIYDSWFEWLNREDVDVEEPPEPA